jgi:RNA polymerase sigma-70 factor (ECF subfamily)
VNEKTAYSLDHHSSNHRQGAALAQATAAAEDVLTSIDRQHRSALLQEALRLTRGDETEAEDLVQETFLKALRHDRRGREIRDRSRRWLLTILTNTYIDRYRRRVVRPAELPYDEATAAAPVAADGEAALALEDGLATLPWEDQREHFRWHLTDEMLCALEGLPDVFRSAVLLADVEGLSYRETADRLRVPLGTVMSRIHRGRARIRHALTSPCSPCLN